MVEDKPKTLRQHLDAMTPEFKKALPGHITAERFVRTAQTAIALTRNIEKVKNPQSFLAACTKAAADGLILDGREAALVIDYNGEAQYRPMVRGLLKLAYQSGQIKALVVESVCHGDKFDYSPSRADKPIIHKIDYSKDRGEPYVVYAQATLKDGGVVFEVMTVKDVNRIRDRSDAYKAFKANKIKSTPWESDWSEMARKTVFRRLSKYLPSSTDRDTFHQAVERIDEEYTLEATDGGETTAAARLQTKKRGGAAAALKDVTPKAEAKPAAQAQAQANHYESDDKETGEVYDHGARHQQQDDI